MPTKFGWATLFGSAASFAAGRVFGVVELYVIGAALVLAVAAAILLVVGRAPRLAVSRRSEPRIPTAGMPTRVAVTLTNARNVPTGQVELRDRIGGSGVARLAMASLARQRSITAMYAIPSVRRGILPCGPLQVRATDPLGLAARTTRQAEIDEIVVLPATVVLDEPRLGSPGILGQMLSAKAIAMGGTDFHGLRSYVPGDDPRRISWRASARGNDLLIREHANDDLRRITIVLDAAGPVRSPADDEAFERAVSAAASCTLACVENEELDVRVLSQTIDLRGADVLNAAGRFFATVTPSAAAGAVAGGASALDGLSLLINVGPVVDSPFLAAARWHLGRNATVVSVCTAPDASSDLGRLIVGAPSLEDFANNWRVLLHGAGR